MKGYEVKDTHCIPPDGGSCTICLQVTLKKKGSEFLEREYEVREY